MPCEAWKSPFIAMEVLVEAQGGEGGLQEMEDGEVSDDGELSDVRWGGDDLTKLPESDVDLLKPSTRCGLPAVQ